VVGEGAGGGGHWASVNWGHKVGEEAKKFVFNKTNDGEGLDGSPWGDKRGGSQGREGNKWGGRGREVKLPSPSFLPPLPFSISWARAHTKKRGRAYGSGYPLIPRGPSVARRAGKK
jgi:hypothetical protein